MLQHALATAHLWVQQVLPVCFHPECYKSNMACHTLQRLLAMARMWWQQVLPVCGTLIAAAAASHNEGPSPAADPALQQGGDSSGNGSMASVPASIPCTPDEVMKLAVSFETTYLSLHPGLLYPTMQVRSPPPVSWNPT